MRANPVLVSAVKGFEPKTALTPLQYCTKFLPAPAQLAVISGPSFAKDVVLQRPCGLVAASKDQSVATKVAELFSNEAMRVYISSDPLGVELGGIVKNVVALASGACDALGLGESARAGLITRGLAEMMRLAQAMGAEMQTLAGLSGLGDLVMTATSPTSRNYTVGFRLGQGEKLANIIQSLGSVAEGVSTTPQVLTLAKQYSVEMPITQHVNRLLHEEISVQELARSLMSRPLTKEFR